MVKQQINKDADIESLDSVFKIGWVKLENALLCMISIETTECGYWLNEFNS